MELHYISLCGLLLICAGWLMQYFAMAKKKEMGKTFVLAYSAGVALLVLDGFQSGLYDLAAANLVSLAIALAVLSRLK